MSHNTHILPQADGIERQRPKSSTRDSRSIVAASMLPLEPLTDAGVDPNGPPVIGVALSFPTSETVLGVEYRVNRVWDAEIQEDAAYDD